MLRVGSKLCARDHGVIACHYQVLVLWLEDPCRGDRRFSVTGFIMIYQSLYVCQEGGGALV